MVDTPNIPHDPDAEQIILGNCLLQESAAPLGDLTEAHFWSESNRRVAGAVRSLAEAKKPVTLMEAAAWLHANGNTVPASYVSALIDGVPIYPNLETYQDRLRKLAEERSVLREASNLSAGIGAGVTVEEVRERAQKIVEHTAPPAAKKSKLVYL